ncbi:hypothetical protein Dsin_022589 [Dipteronia sinensis]|uniref:Uncharacterized protein n=1 Tax=Dipteronia sinensis TaxID=43782 RepID=A0AAE0A1U9_9ROSI|nr:hypothetical protein Dsin_022589 [Dipteronia sinensis]
MVDESTINRRRFDKGKVLALVPYGKFCHDCLEVAVDKKVYLVSVEINNSPIEWRWIENHLELKMNRDPSSLPYHAQENFEFQTEVRNPLAHVSSLEHSPSGREMSSFRKVQNSQKVVPDRQTRDMVAHKPRRDRKEGSKGHTNLCHIKTLEDQTGAIVFLKEACDPAQTLRKVSGEGREKGNTKAVAPRGVALGFNFIEKEKGDDAVMEMREGGGRVSVSSSLENTKSMRGRKKAYSTKTHGPNSLLLQAKVKATKVALKKWLAANAEKLSNVSLLEDKLVEIDNKAEIVGLWQDIKVDSVPLMLTFPRMFALVSIKEGFISDYGHWNHQNWVWSVKLRREPFDWEKSQLRCFMRCLESVIVRPEIKDTIAWRFIPSGIFSASSF